MKIYVSAIALLITACAAETDPREVEAVRDFVVANQLEEVGEARLFGQLHYTYVNDYFVLIPSRRGDYLAEFGRRCRALGSREFTADMVDVRRDPGRLRARFDTIRGCMITKMYSVTREQREEIKNLGDAPGDEIYLPEEADEE